MRGGWSVRQHGRQIGTRFYERTALSRNKAAMLAKAQQPKRKDAGFVLKRTYPFTARG